jgi:hypothetical protein
LGNQNKKPLVPRAKRDHIILFSILGVVVLGGGSFLYILKIADDRAQSVTCAITMKSVGLAGRLWANDHAGMMPTNFTCMSNEMVTPKLLHCRTDSARPAVNTWEEFSDEKSSYVMVSPGIPESTTNSVFIRCRIHGHLGFPDGSVLKQ